MKIQVTQEDIDAGNRCNACYCPIALAIAREVNQTVFIDGKDWYVSWKKNLRGPLSQEAQDFVSLFDCGGAVKPFEFEIDYED